MTSSVVNFKIFLQILKSSVAIFILGKFHQNIFIFKDFKGCRANLPPPGKNRGTPDPGKNRVKEQKAS